MIATNALITKANGLAKLVAPLSPAGTEVAEVSEAPEVSLAVVVTDRVLVRVARLRVLLREMGAPVPVPRMPVPRETVVVALRGTTTVVVAAATSLLVRAAKEERSEETNDETEAAEVADAWEADVLEAETTEAAVCDELTAGAVPDPPERENWPE
jgi:hypothetical protein